MSQTRRACLHQLPLSPPTGTKAPPLKSPPANPISSSLHQTNRKKKAWFRTKLNLNRELPKKTCWRSIASPSAVTVLTDVNTHPQVWEWFQVCTEMPAPLCQLDLTFEPELIWIGLSETAGYLLKSDAPNLFKTLKHTRIPSWQHTVLTFWTPPSYVTSVVVILDGSGDLGPVVTVLFCHEGLEWRRGETRMDCVLEIDWSI